MTKRQEWRYNQPEYRISLGARDEPAGQESLSNEWSAPISGYNLGARLTAIPVESIKQVGTSEIELDPLGYYLASSRQPDSLSRSNEYRRQHLDQDSILARLFDLKKQQEEQRQSSSFDNNILLSSQSSDYQSLPNSDLSLSSPSNFLDYEQPSYNSKQLLAELQQSDNNKRVFDASNNQQLLDFATNFDLKYNPKTSPNLSTDQSSSSTKFDTFGDQLYQKDNVDDEIQQNSVFDNTDKVRKDHKHDVSPKKFTTLLEDEEVETSANLSNSSSSSSSSYSRQTEDNQQVDNSDDQKVTTVLPSETPDKIYYGKVVNSDDATAGYSLTSMLSGAYNKFANFLSLSSSKDKENERTAKMAIKRDNHMGGQVDEGDKSEITYGNVADSTSTDNKPSISSMFKGLFNKVANYLTISDQRPTVQVKEIYSNSNNIANGNYKPIAGSKMSKSTDELNVDSNGLNTKHSVSRSGPNEQFDTKPPLMASPSIAETDSNGEEQQVYSQSSHRSYSHYLHPGDDVYGSYSELRPIYATHASPHGALSLIPTDKSTNDMYFLVMVSAFCVMAIAVVLAAGMFAYRVQQNRKLTTETDYPTYGVVGPNSMNNKCGAAGFVGGYFGSIKGSASSLSDSKNGSTKQLADIYSGSDSGVTTSGKQSGVEKPDFLANQNAARMYHYQNQKQQMIISDRSSNGRQTSASDLDSDDENDDGSYTVYECPGLASAHEMEIKNPLFNDDQTP